MLATVDVFEAHVIDVRLGLIVKLRNRVGRSWDC